MLRAGIAGVVVFAAISFWVYKVGPLPGERAVLHWQTSRQWGPSISALLIFFDGLGKPPVAMLLALAASAVLASLRGWRSGLTLLIMPIAASVTDIAKAALGPSPLWQSVRQGENFPSGHAALAAAACGLVVVVSWGTGRSVLAWVMLAFALGMGLAAVMVGAHLPSDVLAGYTLGFAWLAFWLATPLGCATRAASR
jgi:membrane-associated phospholipid phosphatase